jgi:hypothetical protein
MDFAIDNLGQWTLLLDSKSIGRLRLCQFTTATTTDQQPRKTLKQIGLDDPAGRAGESGQGHQINFRLPILDFGWDFAAFLDEDRAAIVVRSAHRGYLRS